MQSDDLTASIARLKPSEEFRDLLAQIRNRPFRADKTSVEELRAQFETFAAGFYEPPAARFEPADVDGLPVEWIVADSATASNVVLFFHGGGYSVGSVASHRDLCARISDASGVAVLSVDYRLAPEHLFPAAVDDALAAYRWLRAQGTEPQRVCVCGDSAGGGLAMALMVAARDAGEPLPAGAVCFSPLVDLAHEGESAHTRAAEDPLVNPTSSHTLGERYVGHGGDLKHPLASPLYADLTGLPPVFIQVGTAEILLDDSLRLARRLREAGCVVDLDVWPSMIHILPFFAKSVPEARGVIAEAARFIRRVLNTSPSD